MPIPSSELIINSRGAIYHLNLKPEELADTVITVGDPNRVASVSSYFDRIEYQGSHREFVTHTGYIGHKRLSVISTGIGPDNIDIAFNELDALTNIDFESRKIRDQKKSLQIIRLGTTGSLQADLPVDSLVASTFGIGLDNLMHYYKYASNPEESFILGEFREHTRLKTSAIQPYIAEASIRLLSAFADKMQHGITITCPGFYGPQGRVLRGPIAFPQLIDSLSSFTSRGHRVTNFEMETSAMYGLGKLLGHHCLSISVIVANRISKTFSPDGEAAVDQMIRSTIGIIANL